jgi:hypothetical protein
LLKPDVKPMEIVNWLKKDRGLGHGHAMAIYASLKGMKVATAEQQPDDGQLSHTVGIQFRTKICWQDGDRYSNSGRRHCKAWNEQETSGAYHHQRLLLQQHGCGDG